MLTKIRNLFAGIGCMVFATLALIMLMASAIIVLMVQLAVRL